MALIRIYEKHQFSTIDYKDIPAGAFDYFNQPQFSIKYAKEVDRELTYRKLNDWESKGLITPYRETKDTGWRKLSIIDMIKLFIISDLKKFGFSNEDITQTIHNIENYDIKQSGAKHPLDYFVFCTWTDAWYALLIFEGNTPLFMHEDEYWQGFSLMRQTSQRKSVSLPFEKYVDKVKEIRAKKSVDITDPAIKDIFNDTNSEKEQKILEIIKNKEFDEIFIKKQDEKGYTVKATSYKQGSFTYKEIMAAVKTGKYQKVSVHTNNGKQIKIVKEESMKM